VRSSSEPEAVITHRIIGIVLHGVKGISKDGRPIDFARIGWHAPTLYALQLNSVGHADPLPAAPLSKTSELNSTKM